MRSQNNECRLVIAEVFQVAGFRWQVSGGRDYVKLSAAEAPESCRGIAHLLHAKRNVPCLAKFDLERGSFHSAALHGIKEERLRFFASEVSGTGCLIVIELLSILLENPHQVQYDVRWGWH